MSPEMKVRRAAASVCVRANQLQTAGSTTDAVSPTEAIFPADSFANPYTTGVPQEEENLPSMDVEATEAVLDGEPHPAVKYFSERLQELAEKHRARLRDSDKVRKLTPSRLQQLLCEIAPDVPVSQTQMYRYYNGKLAPRIDLVYELAYLFDVSPRYFFPESAEEAGDK
ncbi:Uncharacterised protein [Mycobacteroides abscessus subsp. abscessus]|nr:Uncharacterised protein [Mycobacteroides abscessus subsp. abscessus]